MYIRNHQCFTSKKWNTSIHDAATHKNKSKERNGKISSKQHRFGHGMFFLRNSFIIISSARHPPNLQDEVKKIKSSTFWAAGEEQRRSWLSPSFPSTSDISTQTSRYTVPLKTGKSHSKLDARKKDHSVFCGHVHHPRWCCRRRWCRFCQVN